MDQESDPVVGERRPGGRADVELYARTYSTVLRTSGEVRLRTFERAHQNVSPSLHTGASSPVPDAGALIYAANRLPAAVAAVEHVILGQLPEHFTHALGVRLETDWVPVQAPARRRQWHYDGRRTLAVHVASASDIDDVIPTLVAYQIEWNKLHALLGADRGMRALVSGSGVGRSSAAREQGAERLRDYLGIGADDWRRLGRAWGAEFWPTLQRIAAARKDITVRMLGGTHVGYAKLTRRWWQPIAAVLAERGLERRRVYFVSSNLHSLINLVSGYAPRRAGQLWAFLEQSGAADPLSEAAELAQLRGRANAENVLYYAARLWHQSHPDAPLKVERAREEQERGITSIAPVEGADVGAQVIELARLRADDMDPRVADLAAAAQRSDAVILNIDYPLGMGAYHILRQVAEAVDTLAGVYVLGKAATLNADVGDVLIADLVYDEHTNNTYSFENAFGYADLAPFLERGSVLDNQRAVTVKGTFLQNRDYLDLFSRENYTVVEMEAGPYLAALYEDTHVSRHPLGEPVHFRRLPVDFGLIHYASDTPYTRARTLGSRSLSFEGVDSTYASAVTILRRILTLEQGSGPTDHRARMIAGTMATLTDRPDRGAIPRGWPEEIVGLEQRVPVLDGTLRRYINLDNAASAPPFVAAQDAINRFAPWYASVHRGTGFKSQLSTHVFEAARAAVARFVGADTDSHVVVFVKNTTEALNKLSHVLGSDGTLVYTTIMEHHANMLPWRVWAGGGVRFVATNAEGSLDLDDLERQLATAPTDRPRLVAVAGAYNVTGYMPPIHAIARLAHRYGARLLVDGAQLVPHQPVNMCGTRGSDDAIDFLVFSAHKLYAPYGAGVLVAPRGAFHGLPDQLGGGIVDLVTLENVVWTEVPDREEAGSPNVIGVVALYAAIEKLTALGMANVARHERALTGYALERLSEVAGLRVLGPQTTEARVGVMSFVLPAIPHTLVAAILSYEYGIGVRAGCFCAHPGMAHLLGVSAADMASLEQQILQHEKFGVPGATRASLALYNSADDVDALVDALQSIAAGRHLGKYVHDRATNEYSPEGWQPRFDSFFSI